MKKSLLIILGFLQSLFFSHAQDRRTGQSQETKDSTRVLFIGNSYTYYHNMPQTVKEISETQKVNISYMAITPGGARLEQHLKNEEVKKAIAKGNLDFVVLQEQSLAPAYSSEYVMQHVYAAATSLDSLIHEYNKEAKVIFYMTWGHKDGCQRPIMNDQYL